MTSLCCIHTFVCINILPIGILLFNRCGRTVQSRRFDCSTWAVELFSLLRNIQIGCGTGVGSFRRCGKQPVFPADNKRFYRSFGKVVVYRNLRIFKESVKIVFLVPCILNRFGKAGSLRRIYRFKPCVKIVKNLFGAFLPLYISFFRA